MGKAEFLGEGGTSVLSLIPERDVCFFHKDDNDQSAYPCPSPLIDRGSDDLEDSMALPCQAWFDAEAPESFECDGLDTTATTEQHLRTLARSEVRIESPREILANPKFLNTSVGTQKVEGEFALSEADGLVWSGNSAERIMRLLRSKRSFSELKDQKGEYVTPCDEQLCEQESGQARQMDRGEIKVEEGRRVRAKRVPVLPTDKEKDERDIMHMTNRRKESLPQVAMDHGPFTHGVHMDPVLTQKIHRAVGTCQVLHESSETRAVKGVLEDLDTRGLGEAVPKLDVGSAIRMLANPAWVGQGGRTMAEESSKCLHQSNSTSENAVENIETTVTASDCESPEWFGYQVDSESIATVADRIRGTCAQSVREA